MTTVIQLRIELEAEEITPLIWRRLVVPGAVALPKLHRIFQVAMGWSDRHLHDFVIAERHYGNSDLDSMGDMIDEQGVRLERILGTESTFHYRYDFGDCWYHGVHIEARRQAHPWEYRLPLCLAGENACPPDDVGGVPGYRAFCHAIRDPDHEDHARLLTWCGGAFDRLGFDLNCINREFRKRRR